MRSGFYMCVLNTSFAITGSGYNGCKNSRNQVCANLEGSLAKLLVMGKWKAAWPWITWHELSEVTLADYIAVNGVLRIPMRLYQVEILLPIRLPKTHSRTIYPDCSLESQLKVKTYLEFSTKGIETRWPDAFEIYKFQHTVNSY